MACYLALPRHFACKIKPSNTANNAPRGIAHNSDIDAQSVMMRRVELFLLVSFVRDANKVVGDHDPDNSQQSSRSEAS